MGISYVKKRLESSRTNWLKVIEIMITGDFAAVLIKLTNRTMERIIDEELYDVAEDLLEGVARLPHLAFVHATLFELRALNFEPDEAADEWFGPTGYFPPPGKEIAGRRGQRSRGTTSTACRIGATPN